MIISSRMFRKGPEIMEKLGNADIVVGILTENDAGSVRYVTEKVAGGLRAYERDLKPLIINIDGESDDGTPDEFTKSDVHRTVAHFTTTVKSGTLRGSGYLTLFKAARDLNATVCLIVNGAALSVEPLWVQRFSQPIVERGFQYIGPRYNEPPCFEIFRDFFHHPLFTALYGVALKNPEPDDFAIEVKSCGEIFRQELEEARDDILRLPVAIRCVEHSLRMGECIPGMRVNPASLLENANRETRLSGKTFLEEIPATRYLWDREMPLKIPECVNEPMKTDLPPPEIDMGFLRSRFFDYFMEQRRMLGQVLPNPLLKEVERICCGQSSSMHFSEELWVDMICQLMISWHERAAYQEKIIETLPWLLLGRIIPHWSSLGCVSSREMDRIIEGQMYKAFEKRDGFREMWSAAFG